MRLGAWHRNSFHLFPTFYLKSNATIQSVLLPVDLNRVVLALNLNVSFRIIALTGCRLVSFTVTQYDDCIGELVLYVVDNRS